MKKADEIMAAAQRRKASMVTFVRDMISVPGVSCDEARIEARIRKEMEQVCFDRVYIDSMGNIHGIIGSGARPLIAMDCHIDTVDVGDLSEWQWDPHEGKYENGIIYGRGASDQRAAMASMIYGVDILKELDMLPECTLHITGSVQEEDCDGLSWQYIINEEGIRPDCVVITEPTNLQVYRGHRGRIEIEVNVKGVSCHGSCPERGVNAIYRMQKIVSRIEELNTRLKDDPFLGKGSVSVTYIKCATPSLCSIPDRCTIYLDRRLTIGETKETALAEIEELVTQEGVPDVDISVLTYDRESYTGFSYPAEKYFPTWTVEESDPVCRAAQRTSEILFNDNRKCGRWIFSTNAVSICGMFGIPCIGFGPGNEIHAHSVEDQVADSHLVRAAAWYATFPSIYKEIVSGIS